LSTRPRLKRACLPLRRGGGAVQFGLDPDRGIVLEGLTEAEIQLLEHLDGSLDKSALLDWARERGLAVTRVAHLLDTLRAHALMVDTPADRVDFAALPAPLRLLLGQDADALACAYGGPDDGYAVLARRAHLVVLVDGHGSLASTLAALLRSAGVGRVVVVPYAVDTGGCAGESPPGARPDLAVLVGAGAVDSGRARGWQRDGTAHLPVVLQGTAALVGPVVEPGRSACLRCMDLMRTDRDPGWPAVLSQLLPSGIGPPPEAGGETSLVAIAAGLAAMVSLTVLDGYGAPPGVSLEVALPWPQVTQRRWPAHPACQCGAPLAGRRGVHQSAEGIRA
jgi:hypothetical protein